MTKKFYYYKYSLFAFSLDYNQPFELFKLSSFRDKIFYQLFKFSIYFGLKFRFARSLVRNYFRNSLIRTRSNRQKAVDKALKMVNDPRLKFSECPFAGTIHTEPYPFQMSIRKN